MFIDIIDVLSNSMEDISLVEFKALLSNKYKELNLTNLYMKYWELNPIDRMVYTKNDWNKFINKNS
jgi:hypothetical protein